MNDLVVAVLSLGFVGEKPAELSQKSLPVAGNILHLEVVKDEFLSPGGRLANRNSHTMLGRGQSNRTTRGVISYLTAISCARASFSLTNCRSSLRTQCLQMHQVIVCESFTVTFTSDKTLD